MNGDQRGNFLDTYENVSKLHNTLVSQGQSNVVGSDKVCHHFVCITQVEGYLVELDGAYNSGPNVLGPIKDGETLLTSAARFVLIILYRSRYLTRYYCIVTILG